MCEYFVSRMFETAGDIINSLFMFRFQRSDTLYKGIGMLNSSEVSQLMQHNLTVITDQQES
jgi:hypothetical protein